MSFTDFQQIEQLFTGSFLTETAVIYDKLAKIKAYVFDWDGVFNNGEKNENGSSPYNEVDSMGINMLRFNHFLRTGQNPVVAIISGEKNTAAFTLAKREHFHAVYYKMMNKTEALTHLCNAHNILPHEVAFFFDDINDLLLAGLCGLRIMAGSDCKPMFRKMVKEKNFADYITCNRGGDNALREAAELLTGLTGRFDETIMQRVNFSEGYQEYFDARNITDTIHYTSIDSNITERTSQ